MIHIHAIDEVRRLPGSVKSKTQLEKEIRRLEDLLRPKTIFPVTWGLSPQETAILAAIFNGEHEYVSKDRLIYAAYGPKCGPHAWEIIRTYVARLRVKMREHNVRIVMRYRVGYRLDAWSREFVRKAITGEGK